MKKSQVATYYPIYLNVCDRKCIVIGGGKVALRKVQILLEYGAKVSVVGSDICPELIELSSEGQIHTIIREYKDSDLENAFVAIAATDSDEINRRVAAEARTRSILINVVDDAEYSDFIVPSVMRRGHISIAVSTSGKSPALARKIRSQIEELIDDDYVTLVEIVAEVRKEIKQEGITVDSDSWQEALELSTLLKLLTESGKEKARNYLLNSLKTKQR